MKATAITREEVEKEVVTGVSCDWCGKKFDEIVVKFEGYGKVIISFGYGSIYDSENYTAEICDTCFNKHFKGKARLSE